jgi:hypothetical protein
MLGSETGSVSARREGKKKAIKLTAVIIVGSLL